MRQSGSEEDAQSAERAWCTLLKSFLQHARSGQAHTINLETVPNTLSDCETKDGAARSSADSKPILESHDSADKCSYAHLVHVYTLVELEHQVLSRNISMTSTPRRLAFRSEASLPIRLISVRNQLSGGSGAILSIDRIDEHPGFDCTKR